MRPTNEKKAGDDTSGPTDLHLCNRIAGDVKQMVSRFGPRASIALRVVCVLLGVARPFRNLVHDGIASSVEEEVVRGESS